MQAYGVRTGLFKIFPDAEINYLSFPDFKWDKGKRGKKDLLDMSCFKRRLRLIVC